MPPDFKLSCVLFDLDGTLVDTAPDLIACLNCSLEQHGFNQVMSEQVKPFISYGAAAMIRKSISNTNEQIHADVLETMLSLYENNIAKHSLFFAGIENVLETIEALNLKWGIVTNKRERFTQPLVKAFNITERAACIISGDTTANSKPHPEPMFLACTQAKVKPEECIYIGDALHDIDAGKNANMKTLAATYGYLKPDDNPNNWGADALIDSPEQLTTWINTLCH